MRMSQPKLPSRLMPSDVYSVPTRYVEGAIDDIKPLLTFSMHTYDERYYYSSFNLETIGTLLNRRRAATLKYGNAS